MRYVSRYSSYVFFVAYVLVSLYVIFFLGPVWPFFLGPLAALVLSMSMRPVIKKKRPDGDLGSYAFPSNHSTCAAAIALASYYVLPYAGVVLLGLALLTGISRVATRRHATEDVVFGWFLGFMAVRLAFL